MHQVVRVVQVREPRRDALADAMDLRGREDRARAGLASGRDAATIGFDPLLNKRVERSLAVLEREAQMTV